MGDPSPESGKRLPGARRFLGTLSDIDLRLLRVFATVVQCNGFTAAEVRLNKGKSAISDDIADLEHRLGVRLCQRGRSGFTLTDEGREILAAAQALFGSVEDFKERVNAAAGRLAGELVVYVIDNLVIHSESPLAAALGRFTQAHPDVFIRLVSAPAAEVEQAILQGHGDIGVTVLSREHVSLFSRSLFDETLHLYCGSAHPLFTAHDNTIDIDVIRARRIIETNPLNIVGYAQSTQTTFTFSACADSLDARAIAIVSGAFLGILPEKYAEPWVRSGEMRALRPDLVSALNTFYAILPSATSAKLVARTFATILLGSA